MNKKLLVSLFTLLAFATVNTSFSGNMANGLAPLILIVPTCIVSGTVGAAIAAFKTAKFLAPYGAEWGARNGEMIGKVISATGGGLAGGAIGLAAGCAAGYGLAILVLNAEDITGTCIKKIKNVKAKFYQNK